MNANTLHIYCPLEVEKLYHYHKNNIINDMQKGNYHCINCYLGSDIWVKQWISLALISNYSLLAWIIFEGLTIEIRKGLDRCYRNVIIAITTSHGDQQVTTCNWHC